MTTLFSCDAYVLVHRSENTFEHSHRYHFGYSDISYLDDPITADTIQKYEWIQPTNTIEKIPKTILHGLRYLLLALVCPPNKSSEFTHIVSSPLLSFLEPI